MKITIPTFEDIKVWLGKKTAEISEAEYVRKAVEDRINISGNATTTIIPHTRTLLKFVVFGLPALIIFQVVLSEVGFDTALISSTTNILGVLLVVIIGFLVAKMLFSK